MPMNRLGSTYPWIGGLQGVRHSGLALPSCPSSPAALHILLPSHIQLHSCYSSVVRNANPLARARPIQSNIMDPWLPDPRPHPLFSKAKYAGLWERFKKTLLGTWAVYHIKKVEPKWRVGQFVTHCQEQYIAMNEAFSLGKRESLKLLVTESLMAMMNADMKGTQRLGKCVWSCHGAVMPPKLMNVTMGRVMVEEAGAGADAGKECKVVQATVRFSLRQSMVVYGENGKVVAGDANKIHTITEYVVFERWIKSVGEGCWMIAGKIQPPPSQQQAVPLTVSLSNKTEGTNAAQKDHKVRRIAE